MLLPARNEEQLRQNLTAAQIATLDAASDTNWIYPYWQSAGICRAKFVLRSVKYEDS